MKTIGLTGSLAMGKSTTARMFADEEVPVFDADAAVHELYGPGARGTDAVRAILPGAVTASGVDRRRLSQAVKGDLALLDRLEAAIHPLVREAESRFRDDMRAAGVDLVLFDIPLLFETGREGEFDCIVVASAPADVQMARLMARPGMTDEWARLLLARQLPDAEKRRRADFVVDTAKGFDFARDQVRAIVNHLRN
ncbi:MAG TPA: dephospho-CoA kinase [Aestuariivirgaceae bacterium]|nr:dephospho-CoA kinase [Aestuariivirgaceae bacterium]